MTKRRIGIVIVTIVALIIIVGYLLMVPGRQIAPLPSPSPEGTATLFFITPTSSITPTATVSPTIAVSTTTPLPTETPLPSPTTTSLPPTATPLPSSANAQVKEGWVALNLREKPGTAGEVLDTLAEFAPLVVIGRTETSDWIQVIALEKSIVGWVAAEYVDIDADLAAMPVTGEVTDAPGAPQAIGPDGAPQPSSLISGVSSNAAQIYRRGLQMGNRGNIFAKVGDSITHAEAYLHKIGHGDYDLHGYTHLQPALNFFISTPVQGANSFSRTSFAAFGGWTVRNVLQPGGSHAAECNGQTPLECEYNFIKPAVSLIMLGTNDSGGLPVEEFDSSMHAIVQKTIEMGIIPVLSTIPPKNTGHPNDARVMEFNQVIINIARQYDIPLIDYYTAMLSLPGQGLSEDGIHPSVPGTWIEGTADFSDANLQAGFVLRNFLTLQMLDALWRYVLYDYTPGAPRPEAQPAPAQPASDSDDSCLGAPPVRLSVGQRGRVTRTVNVRTQANPDAQDIGDLRLGETFMVQEGPVCNQGLIWWRVDGVTGVNGWIASGLGAEYWIEPY